MMMAESMGSIAEDYFCNLNPLAKRISEDIRTTKQAYEDLWDTLSLTEQNQAIDEMIIQPEVALKYSSISDVNFPRDLHEFYPKLRIQTGLKYIIDETGSTLRWRDEHSAPFSFMTQSQMNLNLIEYAENSKTKKMGTFDVDSPHFVRQMVMEDCSFESSLNDYSTASSNGVSFYQTSESYSDCVFKNMDTIGLNNCPNNDNTDNIFTKLMNKTSLMKINSSADDDMESLVPQKNIAIINGHKNIIIGTNGNKNNMNINLSNARPKSGDINESTALLETPSSYSSFQSSQANQDDGIPKTGFEFLDNW